MARKKMAQAPAPELTLTSVGSFKHACQRLLKRCMIKNGKNIDAKLSRDASQCGSKKRIALPDCLDDRFS